MTLKDVLMSMAHAKLKAEVKKFQIKGYSTKSKEELVNSMVAKGDLFKYLDTEENRAKVKATKKQPKKKITLKEFKPKTRAQPLNLRQFGAAVDKLKELITKAREVDKMPLNDVYKYEQTRSDVLQYMDLNKTKGNKPLYKKIREKYPSVLGERKSPNIPESFYKAFM